VGARSGDKRSEQAINKIPASPAGFLFFHRPNQHQEKHKSQPRRVGFCASGVSYAPNISFKITVRSNINCAEQNYIIPSKLPRSYLAESAQ
jgi:hypothetical protein